jgi:hypothetical protein
VLVKHGRLWLVVAQCNAQRQQMPIDAGAVAGGAHVALMSGDGSGQQRCRCSRISRHYVTCVRWFHVSSI